MASGGARNRSGPQSDPRSARSDRRGLSFTVLPSEGFDGDAPAFPLPTRRVMRWVYEDKARWQELDEPATERVADREAEMWAWAWGLPQACAWSSPQYPHLVMSVAMWVRTYVVCEGSDATAADKGSLHRFADQVGLTTAGMRELGWTIAADETAMKRQERTERPKVPRERRLRAADAQ